MLTATAAAMSGAVVALALCGTSTFVVAYVARTIPHLSLLVALLSYTLQTVLIIAALGQVARSGAQISGWFAVGVIAVALAWTLVAIVRHRRSRVPAFDLVEPVAR